MYQILNTADAIYCVSSIFSVVEFFFAKSICIFDLHLHCASIANVHHLLPMLDAKIASPSLATWP